jgi:hypothetical protein
VKCKKHANYNHAGKSQGEWCAKHKEDGAELVTHKYCEGKLNTSCPDHTLANFGQKGTKKPRWCAACKPTGAINVTAKRCEDKECEEGGIAAYNEFLGIHTSKTGKWCRSCRDQRHQDAVYVRSGWCEDCHEVHPAFGLPGGRPQWCGHCRTKRTGAVNVTAAHCECEDPKQASYNERGLPPKYCAVCKTDKMIDVKANLCTTCEKHMTLGRSGDVTASACATCPNRPDDLVAIRARKGTPRPNRKRKRNGPPKRRDKKCIKCKVNTANFYRPGHRGKHWCAECEKPPNAIYFSDRSVKKCLFQGCEKQVTHGFPGLLPTHCAEHSQEHMVLGPGKRCEHSSSCRALATHGINERTHCEKHKKRQETNVVERKCVNCGFLALLFENGKCEACDQFVVVRKAAENRVRRLLDARGWKWESYDRPVDVMCGRERPDFVFWVFDAERSVDRVIILEVDERAHTAYSPICERIRMINVTQAFGGPPVLWIRYNPDRMRGSKTSQRVREGHLLGWLELAKTIPLPGLVNVVHLYYPNKSEVVDEIQIPGC